MKVDKIAINWEQQGVWWIAWLCIIQVRSWWDTFETREWLLSSWELKDWAICIFTWSGNSSFDIYHGEWVDVYTLPQELGPGWLEPMPIKVWHIEIARASNQARIRSDNRVTWILKDWWNWNYSFFRRDWWEYMAIPQ